MSFGSGWRFMETGFPECIFSAERTGAKSEMAAALT